MSHDELGGHEVSLGSWYIWEWGGEGLRVLAIEADESSASPPTPTPALAPVDDHGNSPQDATAIVANASHSGNIERRGDVDFFSFPASGAGPHVVGTQAGTLSDTVIAIYGPGGALIGTDDDGGSGETSRYEFTPSSLGTYYVAVGGYDSETGTYRLTIEVDESAASPPAADDQGAGSASFGRFRITRAKANYPEEAVAAVQDEFGSEWRIADWNDLNEAWPDHKEEIKSVFEAGAAIVTLNGEPQWGERTYFVEDHNGSKPGYFLSHDELGGHEVSLGSWYIWEWGGEGLRVLAIEADESSASPPTPTPALAPVDDHGNSPQDATAIVANASHSGNIERRGDVDFFSFPASGAGPHVVGTQAGTLSDTVITIYGPGGALIGTDDDGGSGETSRYEFTPSSLGTYYVAVGGYESETGTYRLTIEVDESAASPPAPAAGRIAFHSLRDGNSGDICDERGRFGANTADPQQGG